MKLTREQVVKLLKGESIDRKIDVRASIQETDKWVVKEAVIEFISYHSK